MMINRGKLNGAMGRAIRDDATIRAGLKALDKRVTHDRSAGGAPLTEAKGREAQHRESVLRIALKMLKAYQSEMQSGATLLIDLTSRQDKALSLARKMGGKKND
jgi:hypothetical protein